jgi:flagellar L-ring protein precursor FlgH
MNRSLLSIACLLLTSSIAAAQTSSLFNRGKAGQYGSNQPGTAVGNSPAAPAADAAVSAKRADNAANEEAKKPAARASADGEKVTPSANQPADASKPQTPQPAGEVIGSRGAPPAGEAATAGASASAAGQAAPVVAPTSTVQAGSLAATPAAQNGTPPNPLVRLSPIGPEPVNNDRMLPPATAALRQASFTATLPPLPRQYRLHDLITIIVREESTFASDGKTDLEKTASFDAKLQAWMKLHTFEKPLKSVDLGTPTPEMKSSGTRSFEGDGSVKRKDTFIGRLTAEVIDIKPNGTLVLSARKFIKTDEEEQTFQLAGTCRAEDITADNTVLSTQLADLTVCKTHSGAVNDSTKRGILPWVTDKINPW